MGALSCHTLSQGSPNKQTKKSSCRFVILITSFNNEPWALENLASACWQKSTNPYEVIYINDCSTDATGTIVDDYVKKHHLEDRVRVIHNTKNVGGMANIYHAVHNLIDEDQIVVSLDGDDTLAHNNVLEILERYYDDPEDVWITYGSCKKVPDGDTKMSELVPAWVFEKGELRKHPFVTQHLRTFKAWLFRRIAEKDFLYKGKFMEVAWDMAMMYPMLEMSYSNKANHIRYVKEIVYNYRTNNPLNDFRIKGKFQHEVDLYIRRKEPYSPIEQKESNNGIIKSLMNFFFGQKIEKTK